MQGTERLMKALPPLGLSLCKEWVGGGALLNYKLKYLFARSHPKGEALRPSTGCNVKK